MEEQQNKLDRMLDAAAEVFALKGYDGAKVDRIAQAAGVNKATLYYHLGNKKQLFEAVLTSRFNQAAERLREALRPEGPPEEDLRRLVFALADIFQENPVLPRLMVQEVIGGGAHLTQPVIERILYLMSLTAGILERGRAAGVFPCPSPSGGWRSKPASPTRKSWANPWKTLPPISHIC